MRSGVSKDYTWFWERFDHYLASKDLRQTKQRRVIIDYFLDLNGHVDAETLYRDVHRAGHAIGLATIYRTLSMLREAGLVDQHSFADGRAIFELSAPHEHHDHLVCQKCGRVVEFFSEKIEQLQREIAEKHGFLLKDHRLEMFGICAACK